MSNHSGSYLLNDVLRLLSQYNFFEQLDKKQVKEFIQEILKIGGRADCNTGEILDDIGVSLGICYYCLEYGTRLEKNHGICEECANRE